MPAADSRKRPSPAASTFSDPGMARRNSADTLRIPSAEEDIPSEADTRHIRSEASTLVAATAEDTPAAMAADITAEVWGYRARS